MCGVWGGRARCVHRAGGGGGGAGGNWLQLQNMRSPIWQNRTKPRNHEYFIRKGTLLCAGACSLESAESRLTNSTDQHRGRRVAAEPPPRRGRPANCAHYWRSSWLDYTIPQTDSGSSIPPTWYSIPPSNYYIFLTFSSIRRKTLICAATSPHFGFVTTHDPQKTLTCLDFCRLCNTWRVTHDRKCVVSGPVHSVGGAPPPLEMEIKLPMDRTTWRTSSSAIQTYSRLYLSRSPTEIPHSKRSYLRSLLAKITVKIEPALITLVAVFASVFINWNPAKTTFTGWSK